MSGLAPDLKARIEEAVRGVTVNQTRFLGVVGEEPSVCYAALAQRIKAETGKDVTLVSVFATTFIKGKIVYYYLYSPYRSAQTVTALLARHKLNVAALLQANKKMALGPQRIDRASRLASRASSKLGTGLEQARRTRFPALSVSKGVAQTPCFD